MHIVNFFFNDTATTEIYTLSLHDALPIWASAGRSTTSCSPPSPGASATSCCPAASRSRTAWSARSCPCPCAPRRSARSEEHTSELQSRQYLVCRLMLEKKLER